MTKPEFPVLPVSVQVQPGVDVDDLWERFELFEALHHSMAIANPMSNDDLDRVVELLAPEPGDTALDIACGYGELLLRLSAAGLGAGCGVDLSPWMLRTAASRSTGAPTLRWVLGEGRDFSVAELSEAELSEAELPEIVVCLGASWIWHGLRGTVRALSERVAPDGRVAIGDLHLRLELDPDSVATSHGRIPSEADMLRHFAEFGFVDVHRVSTSDSSMDDYISRVGETAEAWRSSHPGAKADRFIAEAEAWRKDQLRDTEVIAWSVWVARRP